MLFDKRNLNAVSASITDSYSNIVLENVNDHALHLAVMTGEYRWHYHPNTDELFIVMEGSLKIEFESEHNVILEKGDFLTVPAGVRHKTSAIGRTVNLTFEKTDAETVFVD